MNKSILILLTAFLILGLIGCTRQRPKEAVAPTAPVMAEPAPAPVMAEPAPAPVMAEPAPAPVMAEPGSEKGNGQAPVSQKAMAEPGSEKAMAEPASEKAMALPAPAPANANFAQVQVFYATDRNVTHETEPSKYYGTARSDDVTYGYCTVSIPREHKMGELEAP